MISQIIVQKFLKKKDQMSSIKLNVIFRKKNLMNLMKKNLMNLMNLMKKNLMNLMKKNLMNPQKVKIDY